MINPKINGLYAYFKGKNILYIGKGKPLFFRIKSHYRESFQKVPGDTKDHLWHRFFSKYKGNIKIYWLELESEVDRGVIEKMLTKEYRPHFESFRKQK